MPGGNERSGPTGYSLTHRARELLVYLSERDTCPSFEEMREALGLSSKSGVQRLIGQLERRGYITHQYGLARSIEVIQRAEAAPPIKLPMTNAHAETVHIPLYGRIE